MVEVVYTPTPDAGSGIGIFSNMIRWLLGHWVWIFIFIIFVILMAVVMAVISKMSEERREKNSPPYALYKATRKSCTMLRRRDWIKKRWSPINILFFGAPVFKTEASVKILGYDNRLLGYYRGDYKSQDQCWNLLMYREKVFIWFEQAFLVKIPMSLHFKVLNAAGKKKEKAGNKNLIDEDFDHKTIDLSDHVEFLTDGNIRINCVSLERVGAYYYCPVYASNILKNGFFSDVLDIRQFTEGAIIDNINQVMTSRMLETATSQMEKTPYLNPNVQMAQKMPEQTKEERNMEGR